MGAYTFDDFKRFLKFRCGQRTDVENVGGTNLYETWTNGAYITLTCRKQILEIRMNVRFPELETTDATTGQATVDGQQYISVPTGAVQIIDVFDSTNKVSLDWITLQKYLDYTDRYNTSAEAKPREWTRSSTRLYLHPTPDAVYTMFTYFRKRPTLLTGSAATVIGDEWDEPLLELATFKAFMWTHEYEKAGNVKKEFQDMMVGILGMYEADELSRREWFRPAPSLREPPRR